MEIESLNLAMTVIDQISRDIHRQVGGKLRMTDLRNPF